MAGIFEHLRSSRPELAGVDLCDAAPTHFHNAGSHHHAIRSARRSERREQLLSSVTISSRFREGTPHPRQRWTSEGIRPKGGYDESCFDRWRAGAGSCSSGIR